MAYDSFSLAGRIALVTGSSRGIGLEAALALGRGGAKVFLHGAADSPALAEALKEAKREGIAAETTVADLSESGAPTALIERIGAPDILVLNASAQLYMGIGNFSAAEFDREFHTNVRASFELLRAVLPAMCENRFGRIIAVGSVNAAKPTARLALYASTKAALCNLILGCATEYGRFGITANVISPGVIATDRNREALHDSAVAAELLAQIPAGRFGTPEDCAGIIRFLASDAAAYITGADIPVSGGF